MSGPPVRPRSRELEIVRVLFDKHLLERAVNLAEARWDGSGEIVRLAYHWQDLSPAERRQQLEQIGPEKLAQFRALADLEPELSSVLDTLEERGVIPGPPIQSADVVDQQEADELPDPYDEPEVPASVRAEPVPPEESITIDTPEPTRWTPDLSGAGDAMRAATAGLAGNQSGLFDRGELEQEARKRREDAVRSGEELLQRVRSRLDSTARRVTSNPIGSNSGASTLPARVPARLPGSSSASGVTLADEEHTFTPPPDYWIKRFQSERIIQVDAGTQPPSDDQLVALANEFGLDLEEFVLEAGGTRALFGGLKRSGSNVDVQVGPLSAALAHRSLTVIRGRLMHRTEQRMRNGMVDIPGTKASVRMDPEARVILIP